MSGQCFGGYGARCNNAMTSGTPLMLALLAPWLLSGVFNRHRLHLDHEFRGISSHGFNPRLLRHSSRVLMPFSTSLASASAWLATSPRMMSPRSCRHVKASWLPSTVMSSFCSMRRAIGVRQCFPYTMSPCSAEAYVLVFPLGSPMRYGGTL